jgi:hypothetical protein
MEQDAPEGARTGTFSYTGSLKSSFRMLPVALSSLSGPDLQSQVMRFVRFCAKQVPFCTNTFSSILL